MAFTVYPENSLPVIVFRGTDETLLGWKEDYNMSLDMPVAGQGMALLYLKQVTLRFTDDFILTGHSKGGNLAVYSAMSCSDSIRGRINAIYDFDGPHFRREVLEGTHYNEIKPVLYKFIPQSSVIGILLETEHKYTIIHSNARSGIIQHDPFLWEVEDSKFKLAKRLSGNSLRLNDRMKELVTILTDEQLTEFGAALFEVIGMEKFSTIDQILKNRTKAQVAREIYHNIAGFDEETRDLMKEVIYAFIMG